MNYNKVIDQWNAQADEYNQWDELGEDEKIEFALTCAQPAAPEGWIACSDRMPPEPGGMVAVLMKDGAAMAVRASYRQGNRPGVVGWVYPFDIDDMVTHWTPLPAAPKAQG
ncbi:MAG: DUF551 domain-containing protein [Candidatus Dormibacteria bacterium]